MCDQAAGPGSLRRRHAVKRLRVDLRYCRTRLSWTCSSIHTASPPTPLLVPFFFQILIFLIRVDTSQSHCASPICRSYCVPICPCLSACRPVAVSVSLHPHRPPLPPALTRTERGASVGPTTSNSKNLHTWLGSIEGVIAQGLVPLIHAQLLLAQLVQFFHFHGQGFFEGGLFHFVLGHHSTASPA